MMEGYDAAKAQAFIVEKMKESGRYRDEELPFVEKLVGAAIGADQAFMAQSGVLDGEYYDEDDAFEYIVDHVVEALDADEGAELDVAEAVELYMDFNDAFLQENDLVDWE